MIPAATMAAGRLRPRSRTLCAGLAAAAALLGAGGCVRKAIATFRWGGLTTVGRYMVDMGSLRRTGSRVDFVVLFFPQATAKTPALGKVYTRSRGWIDCATDMQGETGDQPFLTSGFPIGLESGSNAPPASIRPGSSWSSVRDLVCTGRNDIDAPPLTGTDAAVAVLARARMASHPVVNVPDAPPAPDARASDR